MKMEEKATEKQINFMKNLKIDIPEGITKTEARLAIDRVLNQSKEESVETVKIGDAPKIKNGTLSMYVSYAKDIFCAMVDKEKNIPDQMKLATDLVKQAMNELS